MTAQRHPIVEHVYQFNNVLARVKLVTADYVTWEDIKNKAVRYSPKLHRTPRWYFERHATMPVR